MNTSWWKTIDDLTPSQRAFIRLDNSGKHLLQGPPGSGKTNLLLLRAEYMAGTGLKNVLIITFTKPLRNFIRSGISKKRRIRPEQIQTFHSWACDHINQYLGEWPKISSEFNETDRELILELLKKAAKVLPSQKLFDAIFVDEAQDLTCEELESLLCLSDNISISGDGKQGIYNKDGLDIGTRLNLTIHNLKEHFRIGHEIARVADRILAPANSSELLEATSNYNDALLGKSNVDLHELKDREEQLSTMLSIIKIQLDAYPEDAVGIICASRKTRLHLATEINKTEYGKITSAHGIDPTSDFSDKRIHIMTVYGAKGAEFRAVHIFAAEEFATGAFRRSKLMYTAVTRAKTSLNVYKTGHTTPALESALAKPKHIDLKDLF
ncbi:UvrD-helicase domain-containing protein [Pseudomonas viridiflava]|uniref:UvrD-helicase domain-containing protein n=1 Tax=Pseudomonas viridiflava TaxID=33069 RepID=UPI002A69D1ED|nr:UvrD-helicase domain-containing protein [Pseudomonas viridiflava]MDY0918846.1 AAA family ATPase [Pseudomonas viridiflava]